jgi:hypothetical protein
MAVRPDRRKHSSPCNSPVTLSDMVAAYHLPADEGSYDDLGDAYLDQLSKKHLTRDLVRRPERLGYNVKLQQATRTIASASAHELREVVFTAGGTISSCFRFLSRDGIPQLRKTHLRANEAVIGDECVTE